MAHDSAASMSSSLVPTFCL